MAEKILVLGLSKSGISAAKLAINLGYDVYLTEGKKDVNEVQVQELKNLGINVEFGGHSESFIEGADLVVTSPGIPPKSDIFKRILEKNEVADGYEPYVESLKTLNKIESVLICNCFNKSDASSDVT